MDTEIDKQDFELQRQTMNEIFEQQVARIDTLEREKATLERRLQEERDVAGARYRK